MTGSGDIRDPEHVTFTVSPNITSIDGWKRWRPYSAFPRFL